MDTLGKSLPANVEAERSVLGAILLDNRYIDEAKQRVDAEDFFVDQHRRIFERVCEMHDQRQAVDTVTLMEELRRRGELEGAGGAAYLAQLVDGVPRVTNVEFYAKIVKEKSLLRKLAYWSQSIQQRALESGEEAEGLLDVAADGIIRLALEAATAKGELKSYRDAATNLLRELESPTGPRLFSGVAALDKITGGVRAGEVMTLTARSGVGKSIFAEQHRGRGCRDGLHGLYCSAEMFDTEVAGRPLATQAAVPHWKLRRPEKLSTEDWRALTDAAVKMCSECRILDGELSLSQIRIAARRYKRQHGTIGFVMIDYDELVVAPGKDELEQQRNLIIGAKSLAIELRCPVIMVSQLRKAPNEQALKRPTLDSIYGSGAKSKHSTIIIFVHREFVQSLKAGTECDADIYVLKFRHGQIGHMKAKFNLDMLQFEEAPEEFPPNEAEPKNPRRSKRQGDLLSSEES